MKHAQEQIQKYKTHAYKTLKTAGVQTIMLKHPNKQFKKNTHTHKTQIPYYQDASARLVVPSHSTIMTYFVRTTVPPACSTSPSTSVASWSAGAITKVLCQGADPLSTTCGRVGLEMAAALENSRI